MTSWTIINACCNNNRACSTLGDFPPCTTEGIFCTFICVINAGMMGNGDFYLWCNVCGLLKVAQWTSTKNQLNHHVRKTLPRAACLFVKALSCTRMVCWMQRACRLSIIKRECHMHKWKSIHLRCVKPIQWPGIIAGCNSFWHRLVVWW